MRRLRRERDAERSCAEPEQFTAVHDRYFADVYRYVAARLGPQAAEDVAAETFLTAFDQRHRFDPARGGPRPWLLGIATNLVARHRRREARRYRAIARMGHDPRPEGHEHRVVASVAAERLQPQLAAALASLSRGERDVLLLVALAQLSYDEVAAALGVSPGTVASRLARARTKVHQLIDQEAVHG